MRVSAPPAVPPILSLPKVGWALALLGFSVHWDLTLPVSRCPEIIFPAGLSPQGQWGDLTPNQPLTSSHSRLHPSWCLAQSRQVIGRVASDGSAWWTASNSWGSPRYSEDPLLPQKWYSQDFKSWWRLGSPENSAAARLRGTAHLAK